MSLFVIIVCILAYQVNLETTVNEEQTKKIETTTTTTKVPILCSKERYNDSSLLVDSIKVTQGCINGEKTVTYTIVLDGGIEINRSVASEVVTIVPVTERTAIGTKQPLAPKCDSNYSGCVPIVSYDLDCADIGYTVSVLGNDKHRLDGDRDGYGCESY
jgi:uncharacterized protein YabE (DUF348 family)